jgi:hypothetical protein
MSTEVIITSNAMEAIAFITANCHRYQSIECLSFAAVGNLPHFSQLRWLKANFKKRKFTLVFGKDILAVLAEIKIAAGLHNKRVAFALSGPAILATLDKRCYEFEQESLSLNVFEKTCGIRTGVRTSKSLNHDTYLDQLRNDEHR